MISEKLPAASGVSAGGAVVSFRGVGPGALHRGGISQKGSTTLQRREGRRGRRPVCALASVRLTGHTAPPRARAPAGPGRPSAGAGRWPRSGPGPWPRSAAARPAWTT